MKNLLLLATVSSLAFLFSCGEDPEEPTPDAPTITATAASATIEPGGEISIAISVNAPGGFDRITVTSSLNDAALAFAGEIDAADLDGVETGDLTVAFNYVVTPSNVAVGDVVNFQFEAIDAANQTALSSVVAVEVTSPEAKVQTAVLLYAPTGDENSKTFYSIADDTTYSVNDVEQSTGPVSATIDLGYFFVEEANLAAPSAYSTAFTGAYDISDWSSRRATLMVSTTITDVTEISSVADVEAALADIDFTANGEAVVEGLTAGAVYAFQTEDGLEGLIRVVSIEPGFESNDFVELEFILASAE